MSSLTPVQIHTEIQETKRNIAETTRKIKDIEKKIENSNSPDEKKALDKELEELKETKETFKTQDQQLLELLKLLNQQSAGQLYIHFMLCDVFATVMLTFVLTLHSTLNYHSFASRGVGCRGLI